MKGELGAGLEELIRRIVREELARAGGADPGPGEPDHIAELVATRAAKLRAARSPAKRGGG